MHMAAILRDSTVVVVRTRPRAIPLAKTTDGFPFASYMGMGLRLAALRAAGAPLLWICSGRILQVCAYHKMVFNRLPVTVLNRLNARRSEIFTEFRLKSSIKVFGVL